MLALLDDGVEVDAALDAVVHSTTYIQYRQLGLIDAYGRTGLYTGSAQYSTASPQPKEDTASRQATCSTMNRFQRK